MEKNMYLIVGLGNPENKYKWTRHNIGFEVINKLAYDNFIDMKTHKWRSYLGKGKIAGERVLLAKPTTYMNLSGESIAQIMDYNEIPLDKLIIIHDEIALDTGTVRIKYSGGHGGHNGISSVMHCVKSNDFLRIRLGVGAKHPKMELKNYVLSKFLPEEHDNIIFGVSRAADAITHIIDEGYDRAMNVYNQK
jgi:PTH1 family peptidyl-tRNA hydrolase